MTPEQIAEALRERFNLERNSLGMQWINSALREARNQALEEAGQECARLRETYTNDTARGALQYVRAYCLSIKHKDGQP